MKRSNVYITPTLSGLKIDISWNYFLGTVATAIGFYITTIHKVQKTIQKELKLSEDNLKANISSIDSKFDSLAQKLDRIDSKFDSLLLILNNSKQFRQ